MIFIDKNIMEEKNSTVCNNCGTILSTVKDDILGLGKELNKCSQCGKIFIIKEENLIISNYDKIKNWFKKIFNVFKKDCSFKNSTVSINTEEVNSETK